MSGADEQASPDPVSVYDDAAVVTCRAVIKLIANGESRTINARLLHVYVKQ